MLLLQLVFTSLRGSGGHQSWPISEKSRVRFQIPPNFFCIRICQSNFWCIWTRKKGPCVACIVWLGKRELKRTLCSLYCLRGEQAFKSMIQKHIWFNLPRVHPTIPCFCNSQSLARRPKSACRKKTWSVTGFEPLTVHLMSSAITTSLLFRLFYIYMVALLVYATPSELALFLEF